MVHPWLIQSLEKTIKGIQDLLGPLDVTWHSEFKGTNCPGKYLIDELKKMRAVEVQSLAPKSWFQKIFSNKKGVSCE